MLGERIDYYSHYRDMYGNLRKKDTHEIVFDKSATTPPRRPKEDKVEVVKPLECTTAPKVKERVEVRQGKLSPHARRMSEMYTFSFPRTDGIYVIPPCVDGLCREIRKTYVPTPKDCVYFIDEHCLGCKFSMLQFLAAHGVIGEFDLTPLLRKVEYFSTTSEFLDSNKILLTGPEAAQIYLDVLSMYDYFQCPREKEEKSPLVTDKKLTKELGIQTEWSDFDFDSTIQDKDAFEKKRSQLMKMQSDLPSRKAQIAKWMARHENYFSSGDSKLKTIKESPKRGSPGYMRVN